VIVLKVNVYIVAGKCGVLGRKKKNKANSVPISKGTLSVKIRRVKARLGVF